MTIKLSVSNIAWDLPENDDAHDILYNNGVTGVEVAPTKLWPDWNNSNTEAAVAYRESYAQLGFSVPALQAILFGKPDLQVFSSPENQAQLIAHIAHVAELANALGAGVLVFGSPKNRDCGERDWQQALSEAQDFFTRAAEVCHQQQVQLCLEPNPAVYQCNFMTRWTEAAAVVQAVNHPGLGLHLDTACIHMAGDDVVRAIHESAGAIAHFHISEPNLADLSNPQVDHAAIGKALREIEYDGWRSIEMRRSDSPLKSIREAVLRVHDWYDA